MKTFAAAAALGTLLTGATLVAATTPAQAAETCRGLAATIVDTGANTYLDGTAGDDVIVSHGSPVRAMAGNDVICGDGDFVSVQAGPGNDTVDLTRVLQSTQVELAAGDDTFIGGRATDTVYGAFGGFSSTDAPEPATPDVGTDAISTGGGRDLITSGSAAAPNRDRIDAGFGANEVTIVPTESDGSLVLGNKASRLILLLVSPTADDWTIDTQQRVVRHHTGTMAWTGGAASYSVSSDTATPPSTATFLGSKSDDDLDIGYPSASLRVTVRMRGGDDGLDVVAGTAPGSIYSMGPDQDTLEVNAFDPYGNGPANDRLRVDLDDHRIDYGTSAFSVVNGVEILRASGLTVRVSGNEEDNRFLVSGCDVRVEGRGGDDVVRRLAVGLNKCHGEPNRLAGGPGDDRVVGTRRTDDVLIGGRGDDIANGGTGGDDTCVAEVRKGCSG